MKTAACANCEIDFPIGGLRALSDELFGGDFLACRPCARELGRLEEAGFEPDSVPESMRDEVRLRVFERDRLEKLFQRERVVVDALSPEERPKIFGFTLRAGFFGYRWIVETDKALPPILAKKIQRAMRRIEDAEPGAARLEGGSS